MSDADAGINSKIRYSFVERDGDGSDRFQINRDTGEVISTASFLGQAGASFQLVVKATDKDGRGLSATKTLLVSCQGTEGTKGTEGFKGKGGLRGLRLLRGKGDWD